MPGKGRSRNTRVPSKKRSMFSSFPSFSKGTSKPVPVSNSKNTLNNSKKETKTDTVEVKGPGIGDSIKTGFGFGIGSAIAHTGVNAVVNSLGGKYSENNENTHNEKINTETLNNDINADTSVNVCGTIFKQYTECLSRYGNDTYHPECIEVKKVLDTLQC